MVEWSVEQLIKQELVKTCAKPPWVAILALVAGLPGSSFSVPDTIYLT